MNISDIEVSSSQVSGNDFVYEFNCGVGYLNATFNQISGWFGISLIDVERAERRQGIAKLLLRKSLEVATEINARFIYAGIISRECLDAMEAVFGADALIVKDRGTYTAPYETYDRQDADAVLSFQLKTPPQ